MHIIIVVTSTDVSAGVVAAHYFWRQNCDCGKIARNSDFSQTEKEEGKIENNKRASVRRVDVKCNARKK